MQIRTIFAKRAPTHRKRDDKKKRKLNLKLQDDKSRDTGYGYDSRGVRQVPSRFSKISFHVFHVLNLTKTNPVPRVPRSVSIFAGTVAGLNTINLPVSTGAARELLSGRKAAHRELTSQASRQGANARAWKSLSLHRKGRAGRGRVKRSGVQIRPVLWRPDLCLCTLGVQRVRLVLSSAVV